MLNVLRVTLLGLLLASPLMGLENGNLENNESIAKEIMIETSNISLENEKKSAPIEHEKLMLEQTPLVVEEKDGIVKEIPSQETVKPTQNDLKPEASPLSLTGDSEAPSLNRTGRQLFYSPNFFYIQNIGAEGSKCITSRGLVGVCMGFNKCSQEQSRRKRQLTFYTLAQYPQFVPYHQQQHQQTYYPQPQPQPQQQPDEFCTFFDQYARTNAGICCTSINNITPIMPGEQPLQPDEMPMPERPEETSTMKTDEDNNTEGDRKPQAMESSEDSDVLDAPENYNDFQPEPPKYDNTDFQEGNNIGYDPVDDNLKKAQVFNNFIRYPWPSQFGGFSGVQQWPPPLPTHPPGVASWPPPVPTHPPNHHYPTHPPSSGGQYVPPNTTKRPVTSLTTKRPTYPGSPTYRPVATTTTTKRPVTSGGSGVNSNGLPLQCGMVGPDQERIVGGTNASPNEFPWIAVIFKSGKQFCGGSLITNNHILTAAHCVARMTSWDVAALTVHLGDYNIRTDYEVKHVSRRVKRLVRHKGFDFSTLHNDIAILTLSEPVKFTKEIQPVCLPTSPAQQRSSYSGHLATVAGWGSLRENGPQPSILQKVQIPIWNNAECASKYGRAAPAGIIESMVCAGQAAKDSCSGDSGGPMTVNEGGRFVQVGVVSWGIGCGKGQYPGVYTRVTSLLPWIYKNIK
ncbi:CLIP and Tryp_SPc domain-containing lethal (2) k05911 [Haematobia irritans]|uniref:CLIP and Tryp_SPc domain-containing lethal (2) k05911 n=1 Tax=Haematobia irritans TaxID=7368 RepID=UPI003F50A9FE